VVKTVLSRSGKLLYLSRAAIPGKEVDRTFKYYKQSGIMAFRKDFLHKYARLEPTPLEQKESVDMNRVLEHDFVIQGVVYPEETIGVDVPEQVAQVEKTILETPHHKAIYEAIRG
jgi:3-deoxy-manno-octulosonate cytidylyltransferase (CMP-KDO synthetase)